MRILNLKESKARRARFYFPFMDREDAEDYVNEQAEELVKEAEEEQWLENASDEELIDKDWWKYFFYRCGHYVLEPIWANEKDYEEQAKRKPNETAQQYEARAYPPEYLKDYQEREKKEKEELQAKREEEEKQKKLRKKRDLVNDITTNIE